MSIIFKFTDSPCEGYFHLNGSEYSFDFNFGIDLIFENAFKSAFDSHGGMGTASACAAEGKVNFFAFDFDDCGNHLLCSFFSSWSGAGSLGSVFYYHWGFGSRLNSWS